MIANFREYETDIVYLQAKRYQPGNTIGSETVQAFIGALIGKGAQKGVLIATSSFSRQALAAASYSGALKLVLIDGTELTRLMVRFNVGFGLPGPSRSSKSTWTISTRPRPSSAARSAGPSGVGVRSGGRRTHPRGRSAAKWGHRWACGGTPENTNGPVIADRPVYA
ncbi:MAG TPA: restriction endonuclease [Acidocella sp.]|nr:restriction endonuclease [Acidocella sp.]